jgi:NAD(P)H-dependent glutamate synthase small subunit
MRKERADGERAEASSSRTTARLTGFMDIKRREGGHRPVAQRLTDYAEVGSHLPVDELVAQASRCMDCGVPFCHGSGCPLGNLIPEFNDLVCKGRWREACDLLHSTSNFPEITGRICPALCEASCTLNLGFEAVTVKQIELAIVERGWEEGWIVPQPAAHRSDKSVAIVGSGPAALAAAQQLARMGHDVTVFEKDQRIGGLLRYGIPDFKLDKAVLDRRIEQLTAEGVSFETGVEVGEDISVQYLRRSFNAVLLGPGAGEPRDLLVPGRELPNVHFAMEYLAQQNRVNAGEGFTSPRIDARGKVVAVIGGGDTGSDCVGTANRQGASKVYQLELLPQPPEGCNPQTPWPQYPRILRTSTSHAEGCERLWSVMTTELKGSASGVSTLRGVEVAWERDEAGRWQMRQAEGTEFELSVDLVLLAMGFTHARHGELVEQLGLDLDPAGNIAVDDKFMTSVGGVFAAGDAASGASLVVRAIAAGREAAENIDAWLSGVRKA